MRLRTLLCATGYYLLILFIDKLGAPMLNWTYPHTLAAWNGANQALMSRLALLLPDPYGTQLNALLREGSWNGVMMFWEIWIAVGLVLVVLGWLFGEPRLERQIRLNNSRIAKGRS